MGITFNGDGTVTIDMRHYIKEAIEDFGEAINTVAKSPARKHTFDHIDENSPALDPERKDKFHSITAKLLHVAIRGRGDILPTVGFLCSRVSKCTEQDWNKLRRLLQFLKGDIDKLLILGADDLHKIWTWVDVAYAAHPDMKSHTGGTMSLGRGTFLNESKKQKIVTKSSTESETVGASDYLPNTIWVRMFMEAQGYPIKQNVFLQDNESAIKLETNGRLSAGRRSRHIDIRHFFIHDRIKIEKLLIQHCPTLLMLADFFTKPLQGALFRKFQAVILGHAHISILFDETAKYRPLVPTEERVECPSGTVDVGTWCDVAKKNCSKQISSKQVVG